MNVVNLCRISHSGEFYSIGVTEAQGSVLASRFTRQKSPDKKEAQLIALFEWDLVHQNIFPPTCSSIQVVVLSKIGRLWGVRLAVPLIGKILIV